MAAGDAYRLNSFVVVVNDSTCGRSLVAWPAKGGGGLKWLEGTGENLVLFELPMEQLRQGSRDFLRQIRFDPHQREEKPDE
jgi:hypothetical protein